MPSLTVIGAHSTDSVVVEDTTMILIRLRNAEVQSTKMISYTTHDGFVTVLLFGKTRINGVGIREGCQVDLYCESNAGQPILTEYRAEFEGYAPLKLVVHP